jgi:hypothetical protein
MGNIDSGADWDAFIEEWQTSMTSAVAARGATFTMIKPGEQTPPEAAVLVKLKVNDFKYVSQAKRDTVGMFAGNAFMDVDVEYVDHPKGKALGKRKFQTSSSAWQGVFAAMTPKQVEAVAKEIVLEVAGSQVKAWHEPRLNHRLPPREVHRTLDPRTKH